MKTKLMKLLIALTLSTSLLLGCNPDIKKVSEPTQVTENNQSSKVSHKYSKAILVYMVGSDLESEDQLGVLDIEEMVNAKFGKDKVVIIQTGGAKKWHQVDEIDIADDKIQRYIVENGQIRLLEELENANMGEAKTLRDFVNYSLKQADASQYSLILWSHGAGPVEGFGTDEHFDQDGLNLEELNKALDNTIKFENIIFDACLMGSLETAFILKDNANFMMASSELSPGEGLNYKAYLELVDSKKMKEFNEDDLNSVTDGYHDTLAILDLSKTEKAMNSFARIISSKSIKELQNAASKAIAYGAMEENYGSDLFDIGNFLEALNDSSKLLDELVITKITSELYQDSSALSFYLPIQDGEYLVEFAKETMDDLNLPNGYLAKVFSMAESADYEAKVNIIQSFEEEEYWDN